MKTVGIGIIGCGAMGLSLVQIVLKKVSRLKMVAQYDPDQRSIDRARSMDECISIHLARKQSGTTFIIGFAFCYSPHYQKMKELISKEHFGEIISMEFNEILDFNHGRYIMGDWRGLREIAGNYLLEKCCHDIDFDPFYSKSLNLYKIDITFIF